MKNMVYRRRTISIPKELDDWVRDNHINLSRLTQDAIRKQINRTGKPSKP